VSGKAGDIIEEKSSKPTTVGCFPDELVGGDRPQQLRSRKIVFNGETGYHIKQWLVGGQPGGIDLTLGPKGTPRRAVGETPIAVDPKGKWVRYIGRRGRTNCGRTRRAAGRAAR
jgi:hypothetical protein